MSIQTAIIIICVISAVYFMIRTSGEEGFSNIVSGAPSCPDTLVQKGSKIYLYNSRRAEVPGVNPILFNNLEEYVEFLDWQKSQGINCPVLYLQQVYDASGKLTCKARPCVTEPQGGLPPTNATLDARTTVFNAIGITGVNGASGTAEGKKAFDVYPTGLPYTDPKPLAKDPSNRYANLERVKLLDSNVDDKPWNEGGYPAHDPTSFYQGVHTPLDQMDVINEAKAESPNPMDPNWGGQKHTQKLVDGGYYKENNVFHY